MNLNPMRPFRCRTLAYFACFLLFAATLHAQSTTSDVVGTVTDVTGAVVPNATVQLTNLDTQEKRSTTSSDEGQYTFTLLKPNHYSLSVSAAGFKTSTIASFNLAAGDRAREDTHLDIGATDEVVQVEAQAPALHSDTSVLGSTITEKATQDLPLNGRNYINLVQVIPGATEGLNNGLASGNRPDDRRQTSSVSVNGQSDVINNQLIDGMDNNERVIGSIGVRPSVDAIQEVNIQTNTFTAEVGRSAGAIINVITKSGTNTLHGSAYEFFRNDVLNANPYKFGQAIPKPRWRQNQFGGSLGGPIIRDRTFFFGDYEKLGIVRSLNPRQVTVPTLAQHQLVNATPSSAYDPVGLQYFNLYPLPNGSGATNNFTVAPAYSQFSHTADARVDHRFSDANLFYARYTYNKVNTNIGGLFPTVQAAGLSISPGGNRSDYPGPAKTDAHQAQLNYIHIFTPSLLLELKAGYTLLSNAQYPLNYGKNVNQAFGQPNINISTRTAELAAVDVTQGAGLGTRPPIIYLENTFQYAGALSWTHGKQSIKVGAGLIRRQDTVTQTDTATGTWTFNTFNDLLTGTYATATRNAILVQPHNRTWEPHVYFQDDWHVSSALTLNLGIRYDIFTPYTEISNYLSNFDTDQAKIVVAGTPGVDKYGNIRVDYSNLAPRVGFALTVAPRTVLRGGFGISYGPENTTSGAALVNQPFTGSFGPCAPAACGLTFSQGLPLPIPNSTNPSGPVSAALDPHFKSTYLEQFNLTIEREFSGNVASISYVGELGHRLAYYLPDFNAAKPNSQTYATGTNFNALRRFATQAPNITTVPYLTSNGASNYNSLQATFKRRLKGGLDLAANYVYARGLDDAESISNNGQNGFGSVAELIPIIEYGNSTLDTRHRITVTANYALPFGKSLTGFRSVLVKGWQMNGIYVWDTGMPFSVTNNLSRSGTQPAGTATSDRPNVIGDMHLSHRTVGQWFNTAAFQGQPLGTVGNERRNQLYGPGLSRLDLSLFKTFNLYENLNLEFRTEAFNVTNTAQFVNPNGALGNSAFGTIASTANAYNPRVLQFAAKLKF